MGHLPVLGVLNEEHIPELRDGAERGVGPVRLRVPAEHGAPAGAQLLVDPHGQLIRIGRQIPLPDVVPCEPGRRWARASSSWRAPGWRGGEKRLAGMVLLGKGCPVTGSMIVVVKRPASSLGKRNVQEVL